MVQEATAVLMHINIYKLYLISLLLLFTYFIYTVHGTVYTHSWTQECMCIFSVIVYYVMCGKSIQTAFRTMHNLDDLYCVDLYRFVMICSFGRTVVPKKRVVLLLQTKRHLLMLMKLSSKYKIYKEVYRVPTVTRCGKHTIDRANIV